MSSGLPSPEECHASLAKHGHFDVETKTWFIGPSQHSEQAALKIAEYCLITGQHLTAIGTVDGFLNLARRIVALEQRS